MKSLKELYRIGHGPSSSHAVAPGNASLFLKNLYPSATKVIVTLYESFAFTGKGHLTDQVIIQAFSPIPCEVIFDLCLIKNNWFVISNARRNPANIDEISPLGRNDKF